MQGADHPDTLNTLASLAAAYHLAGKPEQALPLFEQAAAGLEKRRFQHEYAGTIIPNTIAAYEKARQYDKAESWRRKWLAVVKQRAGARSPDYAGELAGLGSNLLQQKKWADAEAVLRESLPIQEKQAPGAWATSHTQSLLGGALLGQEKYAEAEPLVVKGFEGMNERAATAPPKGKGRPATAPDANANTSASIFSFCAAAAKKGRVSWLHALRDPVMAAALGALHAEPARPWTIDSLADRVAVSRATLARRFPALVGETPAAYLTRWRMDLASRRLRDTDDPVYVGAPSGRLHLRVRILPRLLPRAWRTAGAVSGTGPR